jgi:hypothetical protein
MDAGIADTINRRDVQRIVRRLDENDEALGYTPIAPWWNAPIADTLLGDSPASNADRAWFVGTLAARTPGVAFDGAPADCDWDNLFSHFRAEILARRTPDPKTPPVQAAEDCLGKVV